MTTEQNTSNITKPIHYPTHIQEIPNHPVYLNRQLPKKLTAFEKVELNVDWILYYLRAGWSWSSVAVLLEMTPATLIKYFDKLVPEEEWKRPVAVMLPSLKPLKSHQEGNE